MSGYLITNYEILDAVRIEELGPRCLPVLEEYGGELLVASSVTQLEGSSFTHMVVYKFPTYEAAIGYYESGEIQELSKLRREITEGTVVCVSSYEVN